MSTTGSSVVKHEHDQWDRLFRHELKKKGSDLYSSYWWQHYYAQLADHVRQHISPSSNILEAGCGSGKASIVLGPKLKRTLLDISGEALEFSRLIASRFNASNITYIEADVFKMPFRKKTFDFAWNIGVVEHYGRADVNRLLRIMMDVTKRDGCIGVGFPNFHSLPIIKAKLLNHKALKWVPGYRLDTEIPYTPDEIIHIAKNAARRIGRKVDEVRVYKAGVPLFVESPKWLVRSVGRVAASLWPDRHFLYLVVVRVG